MEIVDWLFGLSLKSEQLSSWQMCDRALLVYVALIALVRLGKKRSLGRATAFDVVLVIIIGSIAGRAITGGAPLIPALASLLVLIALHWFFSLVSERSTALAPQSKASQRRSSRAARWIAKRCRQAHMSNDDLEEDLREKGVSKVTEVDDAYLERSGRLSVVKKQR